MTNTDQRATPQHQTPASIRDVTFQRKMLGLEADRVYEFLDVLADQLQGTESELSAARAENEHMRAKLDEYEEASERVNEQVVEMFSQAQLVAEEMVADVSRDSRERIGQAREHERKIVEEAVSTAGHQVRSYARTAQAQMQAIMESFATEVDQLGDPAASRGPAIPSPKSNGTPLDDATDWQIRVRNGNGPDSLGSD